MNQPVLRTAALAAVHIFFACASLADDKDANTEARAVIGFEQAGASAAKAEQHFFFDFFIDRALRTPKLSLWGNIRVASFPQQIDTPVAQFDIATAVGKLKVNELAEAAEFQTGLDYHPWGFYPVGSAERRFGFILSVGASGPFEPKTRLNLFQIPAQSSPQYSRFIQQFPTARGSQYAGFLPPDRDRFYRSWGVGMRLTTKYAVAQDILFRPAATYSLTVGQDESVSGGYLRGVVAKFDCFYPLPVSKTRYLYLFGNAALQATRANNITPFVLSPAPSTITGAEPSVVIIATPSTRDRYRLGVGIDAVGVVCSLKPDWCK